MPLLTLVFILSGAAGLIYESIWSRYLGLFVGHSAYAQIVVLVIFLGGMSLGAWVVGERSQGVARPLRAYALVELAAGALGLLFHSLYGGVTAVAYDALFPALAGWGLGPVIVAKWTLAALLILPQSILLGATFPLMSAGAIRLAPSQPGRTLSLLYFANSLGAAAGVLVAGFLLLGAVGLPGTLLIAAALNVLVAITVIGWDQALAGAHEAIAHEAIAHAATAQEAPPATSGAPLPEGEAGGTGGPVPPGERRLLLWVAFGTAVASFIYEIGWIRMLSLVLGSATHSFELMLSAFILGLALGAWWVRRHADRFRDPVRALGMVQWVMGALAILTLPVYIASFAWAAELQQVFASSAEGYRGFLLVRYLICLVVMLPPTICAGMTLPLITRILFVAGEGERAIGRVYAVNTLGSILGVMAAGLVLMPLLGLEWLLVGGALVDIALGAALLRLVARRGAMRPATLALAAAATLAFVALVAGFTHFDREVLTSGVYRYGIVSRPGSVHVRFYRDGRTATVSVRQLRDDGIVTLATNGKPDASLATAWLQPAAAGAAPLPLDRDLSTQVLLPLVTLAHRPSAREAVVIGQGSGASSHVLLGSPRLTHLATVEIEPEMIRASRAFFPFNRRVFEDPRAEFVVDDAKSYFASAGRRFDLILSEPSNPWVSGVSGLFTTEFYGRVRRHLAPGGVFGQWLHLYEINDSLVTSVLTALDENFPHYRLFLTANVDLLVVASDAPLSDPDWSVAAFPAIAADFARARPLTPESLSRLWLADRAVIRPLLLANRDLANSDYTPVLDLGTEKARYLRKRAEGWLSLGTRPFDLASALAGRRTGFGTATEPLVPGIPYLRGLATGARLRAHRAGEPDSILGRVAYDADAFARALDARTPQQHWRAWLDDAVAQESARSTGTAGVVDTAFHDALARYAAAQHAPPELRAALAFRRAAAAWDWAAVLANAPVLEAAVRAGRPWVDPELLRDACVVAALRLGRPREARELYVRLTGLGPRGQPAFDFRSQLLAAQVVAAGRPAAAPPSGAAAGAAR